MATAASGKQTALDKLERRRAVHLSRYNRHIYEGMSAEQIAAEDRVSVSSVRDSIDRMKRYFEMAKLSELEQVQIATLMSVAAKEKDALQALLTANWTDDKGKVHPDLDARAKGIKLINEKIEAIKPKGVGPTTQVAVLAGGSVQQEQPKVTVTSGAPMNDFEGIVRRVRSEQGLLPPPLEEESGDIIDAEDDGKEVTEEDLSADNSSQG